MKKYKIKTGFIIIMIIVIIIIIIIIIISNKRTRMKWEREKRKACAWLCKTRIMANNEWNFLLCWWTLKDRQRYCGINLDTPLIYWIFTHTDLFCIALSMQNNMQRENIIKGELIIILFNLPYKKVDKYK